MTPLERLREQVEAASLGEWEGDKRTCTIRAPGYGGYLAVVHSGHEDIDMIISSTRLARALCDPGTVEALAKVIVRPGVAALHDEDNLGIIGMALWRDAEDKIRAILNALAGMGVGDE